MPKLKLHKPQTTQGIYLSLVLGNTLAASFIWGINTIFLLNAGLSNFEAFAANAFFTLGEVIFEIPTGVIADTYGRRVSYLLGCITLALSTALYLFMWQIRGPFAGWAFASVLLGLGFTFFSGALEAWLVDALNAEKFTGDLDNVFARGQIVGGIAMLVGSVSGGIIAQATSLAVPYILRTLVLLLNFATAFLLMKDIGFTPEKAANPIARVRNTMNGAFRHGFANAPVRWFMLAAPFSAGVSIYVFYAMQPFLLNLYGDEKAYAVAGVIAALSAAAQIVGGIAAGGMRKLFSRRTTALIVGLIFTGIILILVATTTNFWIALLLIFVWGLVFAALTPIRQAYINGNISSKQRATVLSFDALMSSSGGIVIQPALGKIGDSFGYGSSFAAAGLIQALALPFIWLARRENSTADEIKAGTNEQLPDNKLD